VQAGVTISQNAADQLLAIDLERFQTAVNNDVTHDITPNQFSACVSLAYNIGERAFQLSSVLLNTNYSQYIDAAEDFELWVDSGGVQLPGLLARRKAEAQLYLLKQGGIYVAPWDAAVRIPT
jgi:lysozyme